MTNYEKYKDKITEFCKQCKTLAVIKGTPVPCGSIECTECDFHRNGEMCGENASLKWLLEEADGEPSPEVTTARQQGQEEAWALAQNIGLSKDYGGMSPEEFIEIFGDGCYRCEILRDYTYAEAVEKVRAWEEKQNAQVGDVYKRKGTEEIVVVTHIDENGLATYLRSDGSCGNSKRHRFDIWAEKIGRTLPVEEWLRQIGGQDGQE